MAKKQQQFVTQRAVDETVNAVQTSGGISSLPERLAELMQPGESRDAFARRCGVPKGAMRAYFEGSTPGLDKALLIAASAGVSLGWLAAGEGPKHTSEAVNAALPVLPEGIEAKDLAFVPQYDVQASAGAGALVPSDQMREFFAVSRHWLARNLPAWAPRNAIVGVLEGSGDSMEPTIRDGDLLMVVQNVSWRIVERGGIFVFSLDERLLLKRLQVLGNGMLRVISDNPAYEPETVEADEMEHRLIIHGQVFFVGGKPRGL